MYEEVKLDIFNIPRGQERQEQTPAAPFSFIIMTER